jgi:N-acetylglucosamine kinase-like BadF-type ATPase
MIVIADAGGTKTDWRVIKDDGSVAQVKTIGINLVHQSILELMDELEHDLAPYQNAEQLFFYAAGLIDNPTLHDKAMKELKIIFPGADIQLESDIMAVARALCLDQPGWAGILGTGSNLAFYDGQQITQRIPSLGYLLGDEGSGAYLGKKLLTDFARNRIPEPIYSRLKERFDLSEPVIIQKTYNEGNPKSYFASFSRFIQQNIADPFCHELVYQSFRDHFTALLDHKAVNGTLHYSGSVAYYFSNILRQAASDLDLHVGHVVDSPIAGLTLYHKQYH